MTKARILADYVAGGTTAAEFDYMDGVTSNVQTQMDLKAPITNAALVTPNLGTPSAGVVTNLSGVLPVGVTGGSGLTALGTVATGTWEGTDVAVAHGGTGASTASAAATALGVGTTDTPTFVGIKPPRLSASVSATYPGFGTLWDTASWTDGLYVFESHYSGCGAGSGWGYIRKGYNGCLRVFTCYSTYTSFQISGTNFQVQQGLSWATSLTFTGSVWKILHLASP